MFKVVSQIKTENLCFKSRSWEDWCWKTLHQHTVSAAPGEGGVILKKHQGNTERCLKFMAKHFPLVTASDFPEVQAPGPLLLSAFPSSHSIFVSSLNGIHHSSPSNFFSHHVLLISRSVIRKNSPRPSSSCGTFPRTWISKRKPGYYLRIPLTQEVFDEGCFWLMISYFRVWRWSIFITHPLAFPLVLA